jgi:putative flippase GtrA
MEALQTRPAPSLRLPHRLIRFGLVGGCGVVTNLGILAMLVELAGWHPLLASVLSIEASTVANFFLNRAWTWSDRRTSLWSLLSYHGVALVGLLAQYGVLATLVHYFSIHYLLAALVGIAAGTAWNFAANHHFTFKDWHPARIAHHRRIVLYLLAFGLQLGLAALLIHDWDTFVFQTSVEQFLRDGITPYDTGAEKPDYVYWGTSTPTEPWWYAYPPLPLLMMSLTYAPAVFLDAPAWVGRILIKLPILIAGLGFANVAYRLVRSAPNPVRDPVRQAELVERFLLFNPLILLVAAVWGQFELILLSFLLLSFLFIRHERWHVAGAFWGLAALVKIFPVYLGPILLVYITRKAGFTKAVRYFLVGGLVFLAASLPFYLAQPQGFLEQVFLMHGERQPARFAPIAFLYHTLRWASRRFPGTLPDDLGLSHALGALSFTLTAAMLLLFALASRRHGTNERSLLLWSALSLTAGILVTKIVSEQYCVIPLSLLALYLFHPQTKNEGVDGLHIRKFLYLLSVFASLAAFNDSVLFLLYLPPDVAAFLLPQSVPESILALSGSLGLTIGQFRALLGACTGLGLLFPFYWVLRVLGPQLGYALHALGEVVHGPRIPSHRILRYTVAATLLLLMMPAVALGAVAPKREAAPDYLGVASEEPLVLAHYRTDWFNPAMHPDIQAGPWLNARYSPAGGYYNSISHKITRDVTLLKQSNVDAVVIAFNPAFEYSAAALAGISRDLGVPHVLEVDLRDLADETGRVGFTSASAQSARELLDGPKFDYWSDGYHLRLAPDRAHLLLLAGVDRVGYTFSEDERRYVAGFLEDRWDRPSLQALQEPGKSLWQSAPRSQEELAQGSFQAQAWRLAYDEARLEWWTRTFSFLDPKDPQSSLELLVDAVPEIDVAALAPVEVLGLYTPIIDLPADGVMGEGAMATLVADPLEPGAMQDQWLQARDTAVAALVSWNDFDLGLGIEPTVEQGDALLALVREWQADEASGSP